MAIINETHVDSRWSQFLRNRARGDIQEAFEEFTLALAAGTVQIPEPALPDTPVYAGGVNYCPNSDLKFSTMVATVPGTLPGAAGDTNHEAWKFYRQKKTDNLTLNAAHALKGSAHSLYAASEGADADIPIWDRTIGQIVFGSAGADLWDVAVNLYNNDIKASDTWHVRFVLGAMTADLVPDDLEMYCGIWHKTASTEGWIEGGNFNLDHEIIGVKGTKQLNYLLVATTDSGAVLFSQTLNVTDAPDTLDTDSASAQNLESFVRVSYGEADGAGFVNFKIYREDVGTGSIYWIADIQNTNSFEFDDTGGNVNISPATAFPTAGEQIKKAIAYSRRLDVGAYGGFLIINDFTIRIPDDYDSSQTQPFSQFLRFGFTRATAVARQIRLDRIYLGPSFNRWSDSPFDPLKETPSSTPTSGTPTTGGSPTPPFPGSGTCIRADVPVLRLNFDRKPEFVPYAAVPKGELLPASGGAENVVLEQKTGVHRRYYRLHFSNGAWLYATPGHRLAAADAGRWRTAREIRLGDAVRGWTRGKEEIVTLVGKMLIMDKREHEFGTFALVSASAGRESDHLYVAGFSPDRNAGVFNVNAKPVNEDL